MKVYAHRGASAFAPENTMEAFKLAVEMKADGIETDVHMTKDGVLVLMHDERIDRTTDGTGWIKDYTYEELSKYNANYHKEGYDFCRIPKLSELLQLANDTGILLNIEVKTDMVWYTDIEQKILDMVKEYGLENQVMYSSFNHYSLRKLKDLKPDAPIGLLYMEGLYKIWNYAVEFGAEALHPVYLACFLDDYIQNCHKHNVCVNTWTVNREQDMIWFKQQGVDSIITDNPKLGAQIRDGE